MKKIRVWDLPLRLFHWTLAALIVVSVVTHNIGGNAMEWHFRAGYAALTLLLFRLAWGIVGSRYARFSSFLYGPGAILRYVGGKDADLRAGPESQYPGHNPLGSLSVFALLIVILLQALSGMFANDDIASEGPLVKFISKDLSDAITWYHTAVGANLIYALAALHLLAIVFYRIVKKRNLVGPMLTGDREMAAETVPADDSWKMRALALLLLAVSAAVVYFIINLKPGAI